MKKIDIFPLPLEFLNGMDNSVFHNKIKYGKVLSLLQILSFCLQHSTVNLQYTLSILTVNGKPKFEPPPKIT